MPYRDGSGPSGQGPRTGRGAGNCTGTGGDNRYGGRGLGRRGAGRGFNRGFGRGLGVAPEQDRSWFMEQIQSLQSAIKSISDRLDASKKE